MTSKKVETTRWDVTENLTTPEQAAAYINAALEDGDPEMVAVAIGDVIRARGASSIAEAAGLNRGNLYRSFAEEGRPELATTLKVLHAMGIKLTAMPEPAGAD